MAETRGVVVYLMLLISLSLGWGFVPGWSAAAIRTESVWMIESLGDHAFALGKAADSLLGRWLGEARAQSPGSFGEGLVLGLRQILTRLLILDHLRFLLLIAALGFFHEARCLRFLRATHFGYTSPWAYRHIQMVTNITLLGLIAVLIVPLPIHPVLLLMHPMGLCGCAAWRHALYMKQI